ncbi:hypothetical protein C2G38_1777526 [Gigaspora rosea]|uniref:Uncharacterized protein n=1 Tax=Gigaspora rosea TaxID=44941 RepID=A0A397VY34_9GLOM|nr:hypothetical protein C2G38_1777526 [Gigaspora rosea]
MKIQSYYLRFMIIIIFLLIFLPTGFTRFTISYSYLAYQETSVQANHTGSQPHILHIEHYNDNPDTAVVRIGRTNYYDYGSSNYCYEQRLLLRVIKADGSVLQINYENATEIQDINYCAVTILAKSPINFYPLFDQYILATYTHATNTSDPTTYVDRGMVFHWNGTIISKLEFGPSYLSPGTNWYPNEFIVNNITPKNGFLRLSAVNDTYTKHLFSFLFSNDNGTFSLLQSDTVRSLQNPTSFQVTVFATLDGGYALMYANTTIRTFTSDNMLAAQFSENAGIYAIMLGYNQSKTPQIFILYQLPNINFTRLFCSVDFVEIGHSCIAYAERTQTTTVSSTTTNSSTFYVKIRFLSSGAILSLDTMFPPNNVRLTNLRMLPLGGYAVINRTYYGQNINFTLNLYNESNILSEYDSPLEQITVNFNGAFDVLRNNTILMALNETTTSWRILSVNLPPLSPFSDNGYGNLHVGTTYPPKGLNNLPLNTNMINITFNFPISLSDANLTIYQKINNNFTLRQFINSKNCNNCITSGKTITLNVLNCTFNDPGGHYFIQMDNNFVKSAVYNEPILGIDQNMWSFQTNNITSSEKNIDNSGDIRGILRLTNSGSQYFQKLNDSGKQDFFVTLIDQLILMIPTEKDRLDPDKHYQFNAPNILISLFIHEAKDNGKLTAANIKDYLHQLITNKAFTGISTGTVTNLLDETYGFQQSQDIGKKYSALITIVVMTFIILLLLRFILSFKVNLFVNFVSYNRHKC